MKVAIFQDNISYGGRIVVLAEIVRFCNKKNIIPDLVGFNIDVSKEEIRNRYHIEVDFNKVQIKPDWFGKFTELNKIWFNVVFNFYSHKYDLIINSNNSTCLSKTKNRIIYMHYPRKKRIIKREYFQLNTAIRFKTRIAVSLDYFFARILYYFDKLSKYNLIISNSEYTRSVINDLYAIDQEKMATIYPPVKINLSNNDHPYNKKIISIGRISASKNQLMQLEIAKNMKDFAFHIIGFTLDSNTYYQKCLQYIQDNKLDNVVIHKNLSYNDLLEMMRTASFYIHTMENEPFGITTVQAISAGCLPIVHNSGGQKEIVPFGELRFDTPEEAAGKIMTLKEGDINRYIPELQDHIQKFSVEQFHKRLDTIFDRL